MPLPGLPHRMVNSDREGKTAFKINFALCIDDSENIFIKHLHYICFCATIHQYPNRSYEERFSNACLVPAGQYIYMEVCYDVNNRRKTGYYQRKRPSRR